MLDGRLSTPHIALNIYSLGYIPHCEFPTKDISGISTIGESFSY